MKAPSSFSIYIPGHGQFSGSAKALELALRLGRAKLITALVSEVYIDASPAELRTTTYWKQYPTAVLAFIVADTVYADS